MMPVIAPRWGRTAAPTPSSPLARFAFPLDRPFDQICIFPLRMPLCTMSRLPCGHGYRRVSPPVPRQFTISYLPSYLPVQDKSSFDASVFNQLTTVADGALEYKVRAPCDRGRSYPPPDQTYERVDPVPLGLMGGFRCDTDTPHRYLITHPHIVFPTNRMMSVAHATRVRVVATLVRAGRRHSGWRWRPSRAPRR